MAERTRRVTQSLKEKYPLEKLHTHSFDGTEAERAIQTLAGAFPDEQAVHIAIVPQPFPFCIYPLALLSKSCYDALVQSCHATPQSNLSYPLERYKGSKIKASRRNIVAVQAEEDSVPFAHKRSQVLDGCTIRAGSLVEELPWSILETNDGSTNGFQPKS